MAKRAVTKNQWLLGLSTFALVGIAVSSIKLALAITAFNPQTQPTGYVAQIGVSNFNLSSGTETAYRPEYEQEFWSGNLYAYPVDAAGNLNIPAERWTDGARDNISAQNFDTGRLIATMKDDGTKVAFRSGSLSAAQQASLATTVNSTAYSSAQIVNFLRGNRSDESLGGLRVRAWVLGDIMHTRPYYVADASSPTLFAGANDGMLHAINTVDGSERWAYVPSMLLSTMKNLAANPYTHNYYVDGQINIANVTIGATTRVLVGGLGAGGKGLYALDITTLGASGETDVANKILWEITPTQVNYANPATANAYSNLGYTYGSPTIAKVRTGATTSQDAVIIGNGYNNGGDYQAYLYVINAADGQLIRAIKADTAATTDGTAASPNGIFNAAAVDTNNDSVVDLVYAGDLNGTMWKFNLSDPSSTNWNASVLHTTSPAQPITSTPGVATHPSGGYMVSFGTGAMLSAADTTNTAVHYVYGIWDGAPVTNTGGLLTQNLTERSYTYGGVTTRVRRSTAFVPNWSSHTGWKVPLPGGERVVGEGSITENKRFNFNSYNPTVTPYLVPGTSTYIKGENWLTELNFLTGGSTTAPDLDPFFDMDANLLLNDADRIKYISGDSIPAGKVIGDPITSPNEDGIPVGKWISRGVQSQPVLVKLQTLGTTLFNQNPDVTFPPPTTPPPTQGVAGGHFDEDIYYGTPSGGTKATATITVSSTGSSNPATLGGILVDGITVIPALTTSDITNGTATTTNATTIKNKVTGGYTASVSGNVVTITAPTSGSSFNGKTFSIIAGSTGTGMAATAPTNGTLVITDVSNNRTNVSVKCSGTYVTGTTSTGGDLSSINNSSTSNRLNDLYTKINSKTVNGYTTTCTKTTSGSSTTALNCSIAAPVGPSACATFSLSRISASTNTGPSGGSAAGGPWDNFAPALATTAFSGGTDGASGDTCTSCTSKTHIHQYDDKYDRTGVNMLNASNTALNLVNAIPNAATNFKVLAQNQYLNPAVKIHIGDPSYVYNVDAGYVSIKGFVTSATLNLATLPTYNRSNVGSLVINLPVDGLTSKNWWGTGDVRVGLHPTSTGCVKKSAGTTDGNMYQPIIPPANGVDGPGTKGWSASTTPATATGARHGGALVIQIISASTPNSAIEQNVPGRPEYGWRVKSADYATYVLAEYTTFWHHPNGFCYGDAGWTKTPGVDNGGTTAVAPAAGSDDPKIGTLGATSAAVLSTIVTVSGNTTTYTTISTAPDGTVTIVQIITRTVNDQGTAATGDDTVTIVTRDAACVAAGAACTIVEGPPASQPQSDDCIAAGTCTGSSITVANAAGSTSTGGDQTGTQAVTGRVSWHELIRP